MAYYGRLRRPARHAAFWRSFINGVNVHLATSDAIIVGAGITGLTIALRLKEMGLPKVTVLERHYAGLGQSGRAAGVVRALVNSTPVAAMLVESLAAFRGFHRDYGERIPLAESGYLLIDSDAHSDAMNACLERARAAGCGARRVSSAEAAEIQPGLRRDAADIY